MKYCNIPFSYLYLDHYNGNVFLCPWMEPSKATIGNIIHDSFEDIWKGSRVEEIRDTIRNGSFELCRKVACPHLQNDDLMVVEDSKIDNLCIASDVPTEINLAFDFICNLSCPTCRCGVFKPDETYQKNVDTIVEKILPYIAKAKKVTASGHGDPFASPYMMKLFENLQPENEDIEIWFETNGVLFNEDNWRRIEHLSKYRIEVIMTTNSYYEPLYNQISRGGDLEKLKKNQLFLKELRKEKKVDHTTNAFVIQEKNYWEIPEFIEKSLNEYGFDTVVLRPVYNWGNMSEEEYWFKDVLNPCHPYHEEYKKIIELPIIKENSRVYNFGGEMMHEPKSMPGKGSKEYIKERAYAKLFRRWLNNNDNNSEAIINYVKKRNCKRVLIYGAAELGQAIAKILTKSGVSLAYIDQYICEESKCGLPIYKISDIVSNNSDMIIVTPIHVFEDIKNNLIRSGYKGDIVSIEEII